MTLTLRQLLCLSLIHICCVTFAPGCRNHWHIHRAARGGGQILLVTAGRGWYQEWGEAPRALRPGDVVNIPPNVKHWHGAAVDSAFQHLEMCIRDSRKGHQGRVHLRPAVQAHQQVAGLDAAVEHLHVIKLRGVLNMDLRMGLHCGPYPVY